MRIFSSPQIDDYTIPCFVFCLMLGGDIPTIIRPLLFAIFPVLLCVIFFLKYGHSSSIKQECTTLYKMIGYYLLWTLITSFFGHNVLVSLYPFCKMCVFFGLMYVIYNWLDSPKKYKLLIIAGCYAAFCLSVLIFLQHFFFDVERVAATFSNVNTGGFIMTMLALLCYYAHLLYKRSFYILLMFLCSVSVLFTGSRAALLALLVFMVIMFCRRRIPRLLFVLGGFLLCALLFIILFRTDIIWQVFRVDNGTAGRNYLWEISGQIIHDHFWTGIGGGNLREIGTEHLRSLTSISEYRREQLLEIGIQSSHNMYLEAFVDSGVFGFILYLSILLYILIKYLKGIRNNPPEYRKIAYFMFGMTIGIIVRGLFESNGFICKGWLVADFMFWLFLILYERKELLYNVEKTPQ